MQVYIARRLVLMLPTLLGVSFVVFILVRSVPGTVIDLFSGDFGALSREQKSALKKEFGLDQNIPAQYGSWLGKVVQLDFGKSLISARTVDGELSNRIPVTFELGLLAIAFSLVIAVPVGVLSAIRQDTLADYLGRSFAIGLLAIPGFWLATILISLAGRYFTWAVPPAHYSRFLDHPLANLKHLAVPAFILGIGLSGGMMRFTRSSMLEVLRQDYIRTAWAKGLRERVVVTRHALRNAIAPVITVLGLQLPIIVGGSVIIEQIYNIPGVGRYYISAVNQHDYPVIQAINLLVAFVVVFTNLGVDLCYSVLDPRIRYA